MLTHTGHIDPKLPFELIDIFALDVDFFLRLYLSQSWFFFTFLLLGVGFFFKKVDWVGKKIVRVFVAIQHVFRSADELIKVFNIPLMFDCLMDFFFRVIRVSFNRWRFYSMGWFWSLIDLVEPGVVCIFFLEQHNAPSHILSFLGSKQGVGLHLLIWNNFKMRAPNFVCMRFQILSASF